MINLIYGQETQCYGWIKMISCPLITIIIIISVMDLDNNHHLLIRMIESFSLWVNVTISDLLHLRESIWRLQIVLFPFFQITFLAIVLVLYREILHHLKIDWKKKTQHFGSKISYSFKVNGNIPVVVSLILFLAEICSNQFIFWKPD